MADIDAHRLTERLAASEHPAKERHIPMHILHAVIYVVAVVAARRLLLDRRPKPVSDGGFAERFLHQQQKARLTADS